VKLRRDSIGRMQHVRKSSAAELARRRDHVYELYRKGYLRSDIAEALDVSASTIDDDLDTMRVQKVRRYKPLIEGKPPLSLWRDEDLQHPEPDAHYLNSLALAMIENASEHLTRQGVVNLLAHDTHDALYAGDEAWISQARAKISRLSLYITRLHGVLDSPSVREQAMRDRGNQQDELAPPTLRVIGHK
jgi:hypothetical protein